MAWSDLQTRLNTSVLKVFSVPATLNGLAVQGVFDQPYALGSVGIGMASTQPAFTLVSAHVLGEPVGQTLVVNGTSYLVGASEPDGSGMSRLLLEAL
jgi:hypothetical protein